MKNLELEKHWNKVANDILKDRTIIEVRYLNDEEMEDYGWWRRPICFILDNGTKCILSSDNEGNDGGVLFCGDVGTIPILTE
jgi:hypothetical protein